MKSFIIFCSIVLFTANLKSQNGATAEEQYNVYFKKADAQMGKFEFEESINNCKEALKYRPNDHLVRAMICLDYYEIAEKLDVKKSDEKEWKIDIYNKMIGIAEEGIRAAPEKGECYFMRGLANARMSTTKGIFSQFFTAKQIEEDWLLAVNRKADYVTAKGENLQASANVALGVYYRLCPTFFLLKWTFGISGDLEKAVTYCKRAYELDPTRIEIVKEYGVALITRGLDNENNNDITAGKELLQKVSTLPLRLQTDKIDIEHCKMLLADISLCPGYSRDEQQEISEEAFKKSQQK
jgi:tetratricopeptide (TPR) repeat protein